MSERIVKKRSSQVPGAKGDAFKCLFYSKNTSKHIQLESKTQAKISFHFPFKNDLNGLSKYGNLINN